MRLAVVASHPIQYQAPLFRELATRLDLTVFFSTLATPEDQGAAGFGVSFDWDVDLLSGYQSRFLTNVARRPGLSHFFGCDTPEIGYQLWRMRFDGLLVMGWHFKSFWQAIRAAKRMGVPVMARGDSQLGTPRGSMKRLAKEFIYPRLLKVFDVALYVGERSRAYWEHYRYPRARMYFSPHCVDTTWFRERATAAARSEVRNRLGIATDAKVALFAGKLVEFKRPLDLVAAVGLLGASYRPVSVLIAGAGPLDSDLVGAAAAANVSLYRLGFCNQTEMPGAYAAADVLVLPSNGCETWGLVVNEAHACGLPVVVSDACGSAPDLAADGRAGRVFATGDVSGLAQAIRAILDNPPTRQAIFDRSKRYSTTTAVEGIEAGLTFAIQVKAKDGVRVVC